MSPAKTISGARIRQARHASGMTQQALAREANVSERNIVRWENDKNTPRAEHVAAIAKATGRDIEFFYSTEPEEEAVTDGATFRERRQITRTSSGSGRRTGSTPDVRDADGGPVTKEAA